MARHWRMLLAPGFSDCSWAECNVDRGRPVTIRNVLGRDNFFFGGVFSSLICPLGWFANSDGERPLEID